MSVLSARLSHKSQEKWNVSIRPNISWIIFLLSFKYNRISTKCYQPPSIKYSFPLFCASLTLKIPSDIPKPFHSLLSYRQFSLIEREWTRTSKSDWRAWFIVFAGRNTARRRMQWKLRTKTKGPVGKDWRRVVSSECNGVPWITFPKWERLFPSVNAFCGDQRPKHIAAANFDN